MTYGWKKQTPNAFVPSMGIAEAKRRRDEEIDKARERYRRRCAAVREFERRERVRPSPRIVESIDYLSNRARHVLDMEGIDFEAEPEKVAAMTLLEVLRIPNCGSKTAHEIECWLKARGLSFAPGRGGDAAP